MSESRQNHHENEQSPTLGDAIAYGLGVSMVTPDGERIGISTSDFFRVGIDLAKPEDQPTNEQYHLKNAQSVTVELDTCKLDPFVQVLGLTWAREGQKHGVAFEGSSLSELLSRAADWLESPANGETFLAGEVRKAADNG